MKNKLRNETKEHRLNMAEGNLFWMKFDIPLIFVSSLLNKLRIRKLLSYCTQTLISGLSRL